MAAAGGGVRWLAKLLGVAVALEYVCISSYWHVQMFDTSKQLTLSGLLLSVSSSTSSSSAQVLQAQVQAWAAWLPGWLLDGVSITASSIGSMQLRLLLPQMVYGLAMLAAVAVPVVLAGLKLLPGRKVQQPAWGASVLVAVVAVFSGPLVLVLGYAGPLTVLLGMLQACCCVGLLQQQLAAQVLCAACHEPSSGDTGSGMPGSNGSAGKHKGDANTPASLASRAVVLARDIMERQAVAQRDVHMTMVQGQGQYCGVGGAVWLLMSSQLFFCSQHFCEFTGLQYTSPFIGFDDMEYYRGFVMLSINSFGMYMIAALSLPLLVAAYLAHAAQLLSGLHQLGGASGGKVEVREAVQASQCFQQAAGMFSVLRALCLCMSMLASIIMLRHILMWAIFAPKLVFEFWFAAWVDVFVLLAAWLAHRLLSQ
jgi:phosphatidylinositol glycan class O